MAEGFDGSQHGAGTVTRYVIAQRSSSMMCDTSVCSISGVRVGHRWSRAKGGKTEGGKNNRHLTEINTGVKKKHAMVKGKNRARPIKYAYNMAFMSFSGLYGF